MDFLLTDVLYKTFCTEGAFYKIELDGESYTCRGLAKICRKGIDTDVADALIVMVNPGSSQPTDKKYAIPKYTGRLSSIPLVAAKTDQTQQQLMRLMECRGWNMIYIINLSDLRAGSILEFRGHLEKFKDKKNDSHSIFSLNRKKEINKLLTEKTKLIVGWGVHSVKREKMREVLVMLKGEREVFGIPHSTHPYYLHPRPALIEKRIEWLKNMNKILDDEN